MLGHQVHVLGVAVDSLAVRGSGGVSRLVPCDVFLGRTHQDATLREQLEPGAHVLAVGHESTSISLASRNPPATIPKTASTSRRNSPKYAHRPSGVFRFALRAAGVIISLPPSSARTQPSASQ